MKTKYRKAHVVMMFSEDESKIEGVRLTATHYCSAEAAKRRHGHCFIKLSDKPEDALLLNTGCQHPTNHIEISHCEYVQVCDLCGKELS